ncbi:MULTISPECIES: hypothetical protein [unclassified Lysobacter]|uniref:hypothetical protein n=1 Tax=unclassified Lysobacter TaxID=2635362 RepID=UPI001BE88F49|nr:MULTISPECIES: hypothetical protein [unclassified Lysobacter]MBT2749041.1 hypothetical protein [Lysobacter sp. ISL-42]MBT2750374.1 hypothetical protein [Lysobacter sp. ISL-50]MBT2778472.1 hypothetical protein [Lysobacter sp. ISL-54]MBT2781088.1 hypothetical protein [Lysobacter sp. ISL-52]
MNTHTNYTAASDDAPLPEALRRLLEHELSPGARLAYVGLLLLALAAGIAVASLWITEPSLPMRTQVAFAVLLAIALSWCGFAIWALRHRRVLYARHRLVSARMATLFCSVFSVGAFALAGSGGGPGAFLAGVLGLFMLALALALLVRAHRYYGGLQRRRSELQRALGERG